MYDDLIKRLQEDKPSRRMMLTAADAIEKLDNWWAQADKLIKMLEMPRWIPVTERLPGLLEPCLVYSESQPMMVGWRIDDKRFRIPGSFLPDHPTHWQPLPEPPKEG